MVKYVCDEVCEVGEIRFRENGEAEKRTRSTLSYSYEHTLPPTHPPELHALEKSVLDCRATAYTDVRKRR
jgi:hypothetical protein